MVYTARERGNWLNFAICKLQCVGILVFTPRLCDSLILCANSSGVTLTDLKGREPDEIYWRARSACLAAGRTGRSPTPGLKSSPSNELSNCGELHYLFFYLFTKLPWPGDSEGTFWSSSQAATCPPHLSTTRGGGFTFTLSLQSLIAERQAGKL